MQSRFILSSVLIAGLGAVLVGCGKSPEPQQQARPQPTGAAEHAHKQGAHQGVIVEIGSDNYHAEAVFEKNGVVRLYTLGKDEAEVRDVEAQSLEAYVKPEGGMEAVPVTFEAEPQKGDGAGKTSRFVARMPMELWGKPVTVTVPNITIAGQRFRFVIPSVAVAHEEPVKIDTEKEKALCLTPGGKYTPTDIRANGNLTPSQKYGVAGWHLGDEPKAGDKVCPVTASKADPRCTWVIDGKKYEFCCPPCIGKFVRKAKEDPKEIKDPEEYREK